MTDGINISVYSTQIIPTQYELKGYSGLELIAALLAKYLDDHGHTVSLFATTDSYHPPNGHLYAMQPASASFGKNIAFGQGVPPHEVFKQYWKDERSKQALMESDIICDMSWGYYPYALKDTKGDALCHVHHGPDPGFQQKPPMEHPCLMGVSHNHAMRLSDMSGSTFRGVQNGIYLPHYPYHAEKDDYLLWISRIYAFKGTHRFIDICEKSKQHGIIAGGSFGDTKDYVDMIKKRCEASSYVEYLGEVSFDKKVDLYQHARAVLLPTINTLPLGDGSTGSFIEPYGLVVPEANACGTPVIVTPSGGWQETMLHGYNGYHALSNDEFIHYINRLDEIQPEDCRRMAEHFSYERMGHNYLHVFQDILEGKRW
jgi:glycosyltransferase involved in cell wall biosynthesis